MLLDVQSVYCQRNIHEITTENNVKIYTFIIPDELFNFYERNNICKVGFGKEVAARILEHPHLIVAAYEGAELNEALRLMLESEGLQ